MNASPKLRLKPVAALGEHDLYVLRSADNRDLIYKFTENHLLKIFGSPQTGKSSFLNRIKRTLSSELMFIYVDLLEIGQAEALAFYNTLIRKILRELPPELHGEQPRLGPEWEQPEAVMALWPAFVERHLLAASDKAASRQADSLPKVVICLDELNLLAGGQYKQLPLLAAIAAHRHPRICYTLSGIVSEQQLIDLGLPELVHGGQTLELGDFTQEEVRQFLPCLSALGARAEDWLEAVYLQTNGHPGMTQLLLTQLLRTAGAAEREPSVIKDKVKELVHRKFLRFEAAMAENPGVGYIGSSISEICRIWPQERTHQLLSLYGNALANKGVLQPQDSRLAQHLRMIGLLRRELADGREIVLPRNEIYRALFNADWLQQVKDMLPHDAGGRAPGQ